MPEKETGRRTQSNENVRRGLRHGELILIGDYISIELKIPRSRGFERDIERAARVGTGVRACEAGFSGASSLHSAIRYNGAAMPGRNLQIVRFIGTTPSVAYCDVCRLTFRTRQEFLLDSEKAKQQLQSDFEKHECKPEPRAVDDVLAHIR